MYDPPPLNRYSVRTPPLQMKVDHTRDMVRLSMLDSVTDSNDPGDDSSSCFGSLSGVVPEEEGVTAGGGSEEGGHRTPAGPPADVLSDRTVGLGPGEFFGGGFLPHPRGCTRAQRSKSLAVLEA